MGIGDHALVTFIDYSKAFDSISHVQLFDIMLGFPEHIVALLLSLYVDQTAVIRWNGSTTDTFPIGKGVRQGCILYPHLFSLYTESVVIEAEIQDLGYSIGGKNGVSTMFPGYYVHRYICPRTYVPRYICSPVPMSSGTDVPLFWYCK